MSVIFAGDRSGTGKTTITLSLLAALKENSDRVQSFKVGPDYIDPMFHRAITGCPCYNLDPVLTCEAYVQHSFAAHSRWADKGVIEGVMGLFDGATGVDDTASTAHIARLLSLPIVLVVDCGRMARSLAALVHGYRSFDARLKIAGVVLNRVGSDRHLQLLTDALEKIGMPILGVFRREKDIELPSRHLGLVPTEEVGEFAQISKRLATIGKRCFNWEKLLPLLATANDAVVDKKGAWSNLQKTETVRIAIARDKAFNFYYPDNLELLEKLGAELVYWSPLTDSTISEVDGFYFGGGFPEVFAQPLSENKAAIDSIRKSYRQNRPIYAECGGLMYLSKTLTDFCDRTWPMTGLIPHTVKMTNQLQLGYRKAYPLKIGSLTLQNQHIVGHEFHKSVIVEHLQRPAYVTQRYWGEEDKKIEGYQNNLIQASYIHLNWSHQPSIAKRFLTYSRQLLPSS